jgi:hypothetical protein
MKIYLEDDNLHRISSITPWDSKWEKLYLVQIDGYNKDIVLSSNTIKKEVILEEGEFLDLR